MRNVLLVTCFILLAWSESGARPIDEWDWRDGFLGDSIEGDVFGTDDGYPGYFCDECRDPAQFPIDYAAFAYNGFFGDDNWMFSSRLGIPFRIYNARMQWVVVWFEDFLFDGLSFLPGTMEVHVRLPSGQIVVVTVLTSGPDMPVGEPDAEPVPGPCGCSGGEADAEDEDLHEVDDSELPEIDEPTGIVEIVDPDEDDEFPEWEEEE